MSLTVHRLPRSFRLSALGLLAALTSLSVSALSVGELRVRSAIGQPFDGRIGYTLEEGESLEEGCIKLVSPTADDSSTLRGGLVQVMPAGDRRGELKILSRRPVEEPMLRVALQIACGGRGSLTREFVALIDPVPVIDTPQVTTPVATEPVPAPVRAKPVRRARPKAAPRVTPPSVATMAPKKQTPPAAPVPPPVPAQPSGKLSVTVDNAPPAAGPAMPTAESAASQAAAESRYLAEIASLQGKIKDLQAEMAQMRSQQARPASAPVAQPAAQPAKDDGWITILATALAVLGGALVLGSLGWWWWMRRQPEASDAWIEPVPTPRPEPMTMAPAAASAPATMVAKPAPARSFTESMSPPEVPSAPIPVPAATAASVEEGGDRWVLEEAQVFLSHGWVEHALSLLNEEVDRHPYHIDVWLMLFEVYRQQQMKDAFKEAALRFKPEAEALPVWAAVCTMGRELDPHEPLYGGTRTAASEAAAELPPVPRLPDEPPPSESVLDKPSALSVAPADPPMVPPLDFDLLPPDTDSSDGTSGGARRH